MGYLQFIEWSNSQYRSHDALAFAASSPLDLNLYTYELNDFHPLVLAPEANTEDNPQWHEANIGMQ